MIFPYMEIVTLIQEYFHVKHLFLKESKRKTKDIFVPKKYIQKRIKTKQCTIVLRLKFFCNIKKRKSGKTAGPGICEGK